MKLQKAALVGTALLLGSCDKLANNGAECSSADAQSVISTIVSEQIEKATASQLDGMENGPTASKIRSTVALLKVALGDIRTTKNDPNSTKKFCEASLKIVVPLNLIADADRARAALNEGSLSVLAETKGVERNADTFTYTATYSIQPTDDKKNVYGELDTPGEHLEFFGEALAYHLLAPKITANQQAAAAQSQADTAALAQQASVQAQADFDLAAAENKLATQTINEIWKALPEEERGAQLDIQRAWIKKKAADCNIRAAEASTDPTARETARLRCDTELTASRSTELRQFL